MNTLTAIATRLDGLADEAREEAKSLRANRRDAFEVGYIRGAVLDIANELRAIESATTATRAPRRPAHA